MSFGTDFAADCGTGEGFGLSVFLRDGDRVFRTYFTAGRGVEALGSVWSFLDRTPFGRQETWEGARRTSAERAVPVVAPARRVTDAGLSR